MNMESAAIFMAGSILVTLGFLVIVIGIITVNNLIDKYWKPVRLFKYEYHPVYFEQDKDNKEIVDKTIEPLFSEEKPKT